MDIPNDRAFCGIGLMGDPDRDWCCSLMPVCFFSNHAGVAIRSVLLTHQNQPQES